MLNAHSNKIKRIKRELKEFQVKMLDLCDGSEEVRENDFLYKLKENHVHMCIRILDKGPL